MPGAGNVSADKDIKVALPFPPVQRDRAITQMSDGRGSFREWQYEENYTACVCERESLGVGLATLDGLVGQGLSEDI